MQQSKGVFISYRRIDSQSIAGRLGDDLKRAFGDDAVFRDIDDIAPGKDFVEALDTALAGCGVLLAVIGPAWLDQLERRAATGGEAIDHVRREIEAAMSRHVDVIAVLVDGAGFPAVLPKPMQGMGRLQPHEQRDRSWRGDTAALLKLLEPRIGRIAVDPFHRDPRLMQLLRKLWAAALRPRSLAVAGAAAAIGAIAFGVSWWIELREQQGSDVAFVLPPDSQGAAGADDELLVHRDLRAVLQRALDLPHVEIVPDSLAAAEIARYRLDPKDALLGFEGRRGLPRIFIHTLYSVDTPSGTWRMLPTPYLRPLPGQAWKRVEGWHGQAYDGEVPRRVAVKVGFELVEFLAARGLLRLQSGEIEQARTSLLEQYRGLIETKPCDALLELRAELRDPLRAQSIAADPASMRRVLHSRCARDGAAGPAATDRSVGTAAAVLGGALGL